MKRTLVGVDKAGTIKEWSVWTEGDTIFVEHGKRGGKMQVKKTVAKPKNVGKANETTPERQALSEAQSKYNKQVDKYYRETEEEARALLTEGVMLAQDFTKHPNYLNWDLGHVWVYPKLDGLRVKTTFDEAGEPIWESRGGKNYPIPKDIRAQLIKLRELTNCTMLDGEAYIHGEKLQNIQSAVKKPKPLTDLVEYHIFDVPHLSKTWEERMDDIGIVNRAIGFDPNLKLKVVGGARATSQKDVDHYLGVYLEQGYEGIMIRNPRGQYLFQNKRSNDLLKYKKFYDSECKVIGCSEDKNQEGVLTCEWSGQEGEYETPVEFELKMKGNHAYRSYDNQLGLIGKWVNFKYQDLTADKVPTFAVGTGERECDENGNPVE